MCLIAILLLAAACSDTKRVARLERRLDSLAVTLTAVTNRLNGANAGGAPKIDSATVVVPDQLAEGRADAPVTIVEYTDYQCPFCGRHVATTLPILRERFIATGQVRYVVRDLPLSIHPNAKLAAKASRCAAEQGAERFRAFHDSLFAHQRGMTPDTIQLAVRLAGLDRARVAECVRSTRHDAAIAADMATADRVGFAGTPSFVIGPTTGSDTLRGAAFMGAYPISAFESAIREAATAKAVLSSRR